MLGDKTLYRSLVEQNCTAFLLDDPFLSSSEVDIMQILVAFLEPSGAGSRSAGRDGCFAQEMPPKEAAR